MHAGVNSFSTVCQCARQGKVDFYVFADVSCVRVCARGTRTKDESQSWQNVVKIGGERSRSGSDGLRFWRDNYRDVRDSVSFPA